MEMESIYICKIGILRKSLARNEFPPDGKNFSENVLLWPLHTKITSREK